MKSNVSGWVLSDVIIGVSTRDTLCGCNSKTARNGTLFPCPGLTEVCESTGELAPVDTVEGFKRALGASELVYTPVILFVCSTKLGEGVVGEELSGFEFSSF